MKSDLSFTRPALFVLVAALAGCAAAPSVPIGPESQNLSELTRLFEEKKVTDARFQTVEGRDHLKIDLDLRHRLEDYGRQRDFFAKKDFAVSALQEATRVGLDAAELYLSRLTDEERRALLDKHPEWREAGELQSRPYAVLSLQEKLASAYRLAANRQLHRDIAEIDSMTTEAQIDDFWHRFVDGIEESIMTKGRLSRLLLTAPFVPVIKLWIAYHEATDYRGPSKAEFTHREIYSPLRRDQAPQGISGEDWALLRRYAPVLVQETAPDAKYHPRADRFGTVSLTGETPEQAVPVVDTDKPAVYAYVDEKTVQGVKVKQLVYAFWYTEHPQLSRIDFEAGPLEGWTVRVSLNQANEPLIFESVSNCGCYYKVFPTEKLEAMSRQAHAVKLEDKNFYIENHLEGKYDAIVPEVVSGISAEPQNIALYYSAGHHQLLTIGPASELGAGRADQFKRYDLRAYRELESLTFKNGYASLFDTDGLVRGAHRLESTVLTPSGLYHAGHPRQRETQMIYFDDAQFDDPELLETYLRLPPKAFAAQTVANNP
ncbi:MAG: hypothetical protein ACU826_00745 [Gammaproteobacteria bacterium]